MDVDSTRGVELLLDVGLDRRVLGPREVAVSTGDGRWSRLRVLVPGRSPSPTELRRALGAAGPAGGGVYVVVVRAGVALREAAATDSRVSYGAVEEGVVSFRGRLHRAEPGAEPHRPAGGRQSWVRWAILRVLALNAEEVFSQVALARLLGVSHVAVGKQVAHLSEVAECTSRGWRAKDAGACWDLFVARYPGPGGLSTYWAATDDVGAQLVRLEAALGDEGEVTVSGDLAADLYAPWRRPTRLVGYLAHQPALDRHGFASVRAEEATVDLRTPLDPTIAALSRVAPLGDGGPRRHLADPLLSAWDLVRTPGSDVEEAVAWLRERALDGHL